MFLCFCAMPIVAGDDAPPPPPLPLPAPPLGQSPPLPLAVASATGPPGDEAAAASAAASAPLSQRPRLTRTHTLTAADTPTTDGPLARLAADLAAMAAGPFDAVAEVTPEDFVLARLLLLARDQ